MTRRRRRSSRRRKCSNCKESNNLSLQSDCQNTTCKRFVDGTSMSPARENPTPSPVNGGAQSDQKSSDNDSRKHGRGTSRSKLELNALDCKVDKTEDKITFQVLIKETLTEVSVTIEHSQLNPKIIEPTTIISQQKQQQPQCTTKAGNSEHEATAEEQPTSSGVNVEIRTVSFSGDESTFLLGNKEGECSKCQGHHMLLSCSAALNCKWGQHTDQSPWVKFRITTNDKELKVSGENYVNIPRCEQCSYDKFTHEENHKNNEKVLYPIYRPSSTGSSSLYIHPHAGDCTSSQNLMIDSALNIPPPDEFADGSEDIRPFSKTLESICLIAEEHDSESDISPITLADSERYFSSDGNETMGSSRYQSSAVVKRECKILDKWERLPECNHRVQALGPLATPSSSNHLGKNKNSSRNNTIDNIDRIVAQNNCQMQPAVRRKTYPDSDRMDLALQMEWKDIPNLLRQGQSQSSHTHPPFFTQTLPRKKGKPERVSNEDIRSFSCFQTPSKRNCKDSCDGSRISCWSSSDTLSPMKSPEISSEMHGRGNASPCRFHSDENADDVFSLNPNTKSEFEGWKEFFRTDLYLRQYTLPEEGMKDISMSDMDSWQTTDLQEQGDFTESGFDEETLDSDYPSELADDIISTNEQSRIQITPPSPSDHVPNHGQKTANGFDTISKMDSSMKTKTGDQSTKFKKRRHSVTILQTGAFDQRLIIQNNSRKIENADVLQHFSFFGEHYEEDTVFNEYNTPEMCEFEQECASPDTVADIHTLPTTESLSRVSLTALMDDCEQNPEKAVLSAYEENENNLLKNTQSKTITFGIQNNNKQNNNTEYSTQQSGSEQNVAEGYETLKTNMVDVDESLQVMPTRANFLLEDTQPPDHTAPSEEKKVEISCQMLVHAEKQKWHQDLNGETSCLLQLPSGPVQRDGKASEDCPAVPSREGSEHWAKRRQQFKESKQCSSTGGSTGTSNQESVNSEETRSMDLAQVHSEHEQKGIYTDTYNSTSWIFRGDEGNLENDLRCLGKRARPAAIRERTVKIAKGTGDYPWGFRIQFSKPILVTEVDTNGAAEEAGLQIGDIVLAVNGTDMTSIPHSEAATLACQGPDILTLVVGSDISRCPNTPRPACRGYLHKRNHSGLLKGWRKRWFVLKHNGLFYYYKNKMDEGRCQPLDVMRLDGAEVAIDTSLGKPFVFKCFLQSRNRMLYFCSTSNQEMKRWLEAMERAIHPVHQNHVWVDVTHHNANLPPLAIKSPECLGLLHEVDRNKNLWAQHYCVLKDACLYFYAGIRSTHALGGIYLQGYTVSEQNIGSKRTIIEAKPPSEEFKTFYLCADNAADNKRWTIALKASVGRWLPLHQAIHDFMTNPPEETRM